MNQTRQNSTFHQQLNILACMYIGYGAMMICRQMVSILSPAILADPDLGLSKTNIGDFLAYGTIGALTGKLIWGPLGDKIGGRLTFLLGIILSALLVALFGLSLNVTAFIVCSFLLYCTKSSGWPGMAKLIGEWYHPHKYGRVWAILSTSSRLSVILGTLVFGWLLSKMDWRSVAFAATGFALVIFYFCYLFLKNKPSDPNFLNSEDIKISDAEKIQEAEKALNNKKNHPLKNTSLKKGLLTFAKSKRFWFIIIMMQGLTCLMAFLDFVPMYLMEVYELTPSNAAMASAVFPIGSLTGLVGAIIFYDKFSKRKLRGVMTICLCTATLCAVILQALPQLELGSEVNFLFALGLIFTFGVMISPAYYIPMSIFSIEFGGPHSATLICLIDAFGFAASATFGFVGGRLADSAGGWYSFMSLLVTISVVTAIAVWLFMNAEYRAGVKS